MSNRRTFLHGLASLPLIGGSVALIGKPTAAAVPVTEDLLHSYKAWLHYEHRMLSWELADYSIERGKQMEGFVAMDNPGADFHWHWAGRKGACGPAGCQGAPQASTRAAVVLSAVGCPLFDEVLS